MSCNAKYIKYSFINIYIYKLLTNLNKILFYKSQKFQNHVKEITFFTFKCSV